MKFIKGREKFISENINNTEEEPEHVNEFFGSILKQMFRNAKNVMSTNLSKKIGESKVVDKAIEEYKQKLETFVDKEMAERKKVIDYKLDMQTESEEYTEDGLKELKEKVDRNLENIKKQKAAAKKTFETKLANIMKQTDDENVKDYAKLKRAELAEELLAMQLQKLDELEADELKDDKETKELVAQLNKDAEKATEYTENISKKLKANLEKGDDNKEQEGNSFDIEKAKSDEDYRWKDSPYWDTVIKNGTELIYWSNSKFKQEGGDYKGTKATVAETDKAAELKEDLVLVETETSDEPFDISRGSIIKVLGDDEDSEDTKEDSSDSDSEEVEV